jgi:hypothetical protein
MLSRFPVYHYPEKGNLSGGGEGVRRELCLKFPYYVREYGTGVFSLSVVCSLIAHAGEGRLTAGPDNGLYWHTSLLRKAARKKGAGDRVTERGAFRAQRCSNAGEVKRVSGPNT